MNSKVIHCKLNHQRYIPKKNFFEFNLVYYCFDLDELEYLNQKVFFFSYNGINISSLKDKSYLFKNGQTIKQKVLSFLKSQNFKKKINKIFLFTSAKYYNYVFNPVSFYYCYSANNKLEAIITEVNNTFGEKHLYFLNDLKQSKESLHTTKYQKVFHVSPFNTVSGEYHFSFSDLKDEIFMQINLIDKNKTIMKANLNGKTYTLNNRNHLKTLFKYPLTPFLTTPRIFLQAFKLALVKRLTYHDKPIPQDKLTIVKLGPTMKQKLAFKIFNKIINKLENSLFEISLPDNKKYSMGSKKASTNAKIEVKDYNFFSRTIFQGEIGFGESYMLGEWDTNNLNNVLKIFLNNRKKIGDGNYLASKFHYFRNHKKHKRNKNSLKNSKRNISQHYDLNNDFFSLFLDKTMMYSSAIYKTNKDTLYKAQINKLDEILSKAEINKNDHVLEIGCGWGSFAIHAARKTGCKVTAVTISEEQFKYTKDKIRKEKLTSKIKVILKDYRKLEGTYNKIVSIEMLEAVGDKYFKKFFKKCDELLKPAGKIVLQTITIPDQRYNKYRKESDWIKKHIFPGGCLPSLNKISSVITKNTKLIIDNLQNIGYDYALTLEQWRKNYLLNKDKISKLGFNEIFHRKWIYYLVCCEECFRTSVINNMQIVLCRENYQ